MKKVLFLLSALSCFAGEDQLLQIEASELIDDPYRNKAVAYAKRDYDETYFLIRRCLGEYFANWSSGETRESQVLDYGCGTGSSTRLLKSFGFEHVLGIDPSIPMIELARRSDPEDAFEILLPEFDWNPLKEKFDVVSSSFVLPVLSTQEEVSSYLQKAYFALKDDGLLIVVTAASEAFDPKYDWLSWEQDFPENDSAVNGGPVTVRLKKGDLLLHDTLWSPEFLQKIFQDHSFKIESLFRPLGDSDDPFPWRSELAVSPFAIYILRK